MGQTAFPGRKPLTLIVPFAAGSATDLAGRIIAEGLSQTLGQQVIVENRAGAGGAIGLDAVAKAAPDGYTIGLVSTSTYIYPVALEEKKPYDVLTDLVPVALTNDLPLVLVSSTEIPARNMREFLDYAKTHRSLFVSAGPGTAAHVLGAAVLQAAGAQGDAVHYKGSAAGMPDMIAGRVHFAVDGPGSVAGNVKDGRLVGLAVFAPRRVPILPNVPTFAEAWQEAPEYMKQASVNMIVVPKNVPQEVSIKLNAELNKGMALPAIRTRLEQAGLVSRSPMPLDQIPAYIRQQVDAWSRVATTTGIKDAVKATN